MSRHAAVRFDGGCLVWQPAGEPPSPHPFTFDDRSKRWVAPAHLLFSLKGWDPWVSGSARRRVEEACENSGLRGYQKEGIRAWCAANGRGAVVLPTGAGKTRVALAIASALGRNILVLVPTRVLLQQWRGALQEAGFTACGQWGDGCVHTEPVTVSTYHAALIHARVFGGSFHLVIVDECHHFVTRTYASLLSQFTAPLRLGLTATPPQGEERASFLDAFDAIVFERRPADIREHLAAFTRSVETVALPRSLLESYVKGRAACAEVLAQLSKGAEAPAPARVPRMITGRPDLKAKWLMWMTARDELAEWRGLEDATVASIERHAPMKYVVFAESTPLAVALACRLVVPCFVTGVDPRERTAALQSFREGRVKGVVSCRVLNEGFDLPGVDACFIVGTVRSETEYVQRLGRSLRRTERGSVRLVEILPDVPTSRRASALRGAWLAERFS